MKIKIEIPTRQPKVVMKNIELELEENPTTIYELMDSFEYDDSNYSLEDIINKELNSFEAYKIIGPKEFKDRYIVKKVARKGKKSLWGNAFAIDDDFTLSKERAVKEYKDFLKNAVEELNKKIASLK